MKIINILYQSDNNYADVAGVSITSLLENNKELNEINIYILGSKISKKNINLLKKTCNRYKRTIIFIDTKEIEKKLEKLKVSKFRNSYSTYFKLIAISHLKIKGNVILYIDCDTIVNGSIKNIFNLKLKDKILAATYDCAMNSYKKLVDIPLVDKYYNGGILLINQKNWKKNNCEKKIINHLKNKRSGYCTADQDILNVLFRHKFAYLNLKYNFNSGFYIYGIKESLRMYNLKKPYYNSYDEIVAAYNNPTIYHCMGAMTGRPWEENSIHPQNDIYDKYKKISFWKNEPKKIVNRTFIFKFQRFLYKILPINIYIFFHKIGQKMYLSNKNNEVKKYYDKN